MISNTRNKKVAVCATAFLLLGCGSSGTGVYVTGTVTFDGNPVETGQIAFEPQQVGVMAVAMIVNGSYQLPRERPLTPGRYLVRITADRSTGKMLDSNPRSQEDQPAEEMEQFIPEKYNLRSQLYVDVDTTRDKHDFILTSN